MSLRSSRGLSRDSLAEVATEEGGALDVYKQQMIQSTDEDTRRTYLYTGKTSRAIYNRFHDLWENSGLDPLPFPTQVALASSFVESFYKAGKIDHIGPFAGQITGLIDEIKPARKVVEEMVEEAVDILTRKLPENVTAKQ